MKRLVIVFSLLFLLPWRAGAAAPTVFFGEIAWAGSNASTSDEWLEICGAPGTDLSGWSIEGAATGGGTLIVPSGSVMPTSGAFLIANYAAGDSHSTLAAVPDFVTTSVALSNSSLFLTLRDAEDGAIDVAGAVGTPPLAGASGGVKASMERRDAAADGGISEAWVSATTSAGFDDGATELGTPGTCLAPVTEVAPSEPAPVVEEAPAEATASATETPTVAADTPTETAALAAATSTPEHSPAPTPTDRPLSAVRISEIYPAPLPGESEWIELTDPSDLGEVLDGWTLEDGKGTATVLKGTLLPWARLVIASPKGQLNNDGDLVVLKDAQGRVLDGVAYGAWNAGRYPNVGEVAKGESIMRLELQDVFSVTTKPTRDEANMLVGRDTTDEPGAPSFRPEQSAVEEPLAPQASQAIPRLLAPSTLVARNDGKKVETPAVSASKTAATKSVPKPTIKKPAASRYKGVVYVGTVVSPPGTYSKTRLYILRDGAIEELRLSKSLASLDGGDRISFVAQTKNDGAATYLLANPNSISKIGSASSTFAAISAWPDATGPAPDGDRAGGYLLTAEIVAMHGDTLEVRAGGIEGDVLMPAGTKMPLKPGDTVSVEGFITPGARPKMIMARPDGIALFKAFRAEAAGLTDAHGHLPWTTMFLLTLVAAAIGVTVYLRMQRLKRLALTQAPLEGGGWE